MTADGENSVTEWIGDLRTGNRDEAFRLLWERYFTRLAQLAQARLRAVARGSADGEDVALSVLDSHSNNEIAKSLDCGLRTVERKLDVIRKRWIAESTP